MSNRDLERQVPHLLLHVNPGAVPPLPGLPGRDVSHGPSVMFDVSAMEPGLYQPPLLQMERSGGGREAISHHPAYGLKRSDAPPGLLVVGHQDLPVEVGVIHEVDQDGVHRHGADISVGGGILQQADKAESKAERFAARGCLPGFSTSLACSFTTVASISMRSSVTLRTRSLYL